MASGVNKVLLMGRLGKTPEIRYVGNGTAVSSFSLATSKSWKDQGGNRQEKTEWHRCVAWGKTAELCAEYLEKGSMAYIEGELETRTYQDKVGVERQVTEVKVQTVQFLSPRGQKPQAAAAPQASSYSHAEPGEDHDQDLPF